MKTNYKLNILGYPITARAVPHKDEWYVDRVGQFDREELKIIWKSGLAPHAEKHTILHEIVHAFETALDISVLSERDVDNLALGILSLIRDNPKLIKDIQE